MVSTTIWHCQCLSAHTEGQRSGLLSHLCSLSYFMAVRHWLVTWSGKLMPLIECTHRITRYHWNDCVEPVITLRDRFEAYYLLSPCTLTLIIQACGTLTRSQLCSLSCLYNGQPQVEEAKGAPLEVVANVTWLILSWGTQDGIRACMETCLENPWGLGSEWVS